MNKITVLLAIGLVLGSLLYAEDFGSAAVKERVGYSLEDMLLYALEDEHAALAEYEALMEKFDLNRPYSNIARSEMTHISYLEDLYENYEIRIPEINADEHLVLPSSAVEAAEIGVQAEINNIHMYNIFLEQKLPEDVAEVFTLLKNASENHLKAFERQLSVSLNSGRRANNQRPGNRV